jgi:hypothetical protein
LVFVLFHDRDRQPSREEHDIDDEATRDREGCAVDANHHARSERLDSTPALRGSAACEGVATSSTGGQSTAGGVDRISRSSSAAKRSPSAGKETTGRRA